MQAVPSMEDQILWIMEDQAPLEMLLLTLAEMEDQMEQVGFQVAAILFLVVEMDLEIKGPTSTPMEVIQIEELQKDLFPDAWVQWEGMKKYVSKYHVCFNMI